MKCPFCEQDFSLARGCEAYVIHDKAMREWNNYCDMIGKEYGYYRPKDELPFEVVKKEEQLKREAKLTLDECWNQTRKIIAELKARGEY